MILSALAAQKLGLLFVGMSDREQAKFDENNKAKTFRSHYGSWPADLADMWNDLVVAADISDPLEEREKSFKGLKMFLVAHHQLWAYPKNANLISKRFKIGEKSSQGQPLWKWIARIQSLKVHKIKWLESFDDPNSDIFIITVDGTNSKLWEKKHPTLPIDPSFFSEKHNHAGLKYEIGVSVHEPKIVWMSGPHKCSKHDMTVFREGLKGQMPPGKKAIADGGYQTSEPDEVPMMSFPNSLDHPDLKKFKSRARCRHESV